MTLPFVLGCVTLYRRASSPANHGSELFETSLRTTLEEKTRPPDGLRRRNVGGARDEMRDTLARTSLEGKVSWGWA